MYQCLCLWTFDITAMHDLMPSLPPMVNRYAEKSHVHKTPARVTGSHSMPPPPRPRAPDAAAEHVDAVTVAVLTARDCAAPSQVIQRRAVEVRHRRGDLQFVKGARPRRVHVLGVCVVMRVHEPTAGRDSVLVSPQNCVVALGTKRGGENASVLTKLQTYKKASWTTPSNTTALISSLGPAAVGVSVIPFKI